MSVPEELRPLWHAGLAHGANHLVTLVASALDVIRATGASDPAEVLRPLLSAALERTLEQGDAALTGPVARGDAEAVSGHLHALHRHAPAEAALYRDLARATTARLASPAPALFPVLANPAADPAADLAQVTDLRSEPVTQTAGPGQRAAMSLLHELPSGAGRPSRQTPLPVAQSRAELAAARAGLTGPVSVVMTMGALHDGHAALIRSAATHGSVIVSIFVNPLQFGPAEDFERYPRALGADLELCAEAGAALVFAPTPDAMYPAGAPLVRIDPGPGGALLEGASRPGHFAGVLTVVSKLLHLTRPDRAYFGEKDFQQLTLIRQLVTDLDLPVEIVGAPTQRDPDGLALSSRNRYLPAQQRPTRTRPLPRVAGRGAAGGVRTRRRAGRRPVRARVRSRADDRPARPG